MKPITVTCEATLPLAPEEIAHEVLDLSNWPDFHGYGPIPGIKAAEFEVRTPNVIGSRIRVANTDGSNHVEEIIEWQPDRRLRIQMTEFSPPLSYLATHLIETWHLQQLGDDTKVVRHFEMHAKTVLSRLPLTVIAIFLKKAIVRQLDQMRRSTNSQ